MSTSSIRDNHYNDSVKDFLNESLKPDTFVSIVSAYFTIYAYQGLKSKLNGIDSLRFLFGEPSFLGSMESDEVDLRQFKIEDEKMVIDIDNQLIQNSLARECAEWLEKKAEIRSIKKPNFLHGKMYHIRGRSPEEKERAILGSSNFTYSGLGFGQKSNIELNIVVDSDRERRDLLAWFDRLWDDEKLVENVKDKVIDYLNRFYKDNSPEFIYYKTLYHLFEHFIDEQSKGGLLNERTGFFDSEIWKSLYSFQKDGVKGAINKLLHHGGCIIADSVGLGKTYEALAVIKYFELLNERVLVVCPKKLSSNWTIYQANQGHVLNPFIKDRFGFSVVYHTDVGRLNGTSLANAIDLDQFNWGAYDLVVLDESHNFRGDPKESEQADGSSKMNRAKWFLEKIVKSGVRTKMLMLSATPVNNSLRDLRNQIAFITSGNDAALAETCKIDDIGATIRNAQARFTEWAKDRLEGQANSSALLKKLDASFFKLLDELTIARSRKQIKNFYKDSDGKTVGEFPERCRPLTVHSMIDTENAFPSYDTIVERIHRYRLSIFNPSAYVLEEKKDKYGNRDDIAHNFTQLHRETVLIEMMKTGFLKRLESSIRSFEISLERTIGKISQLENRIEKFLAREVRDTLEIVEDVPYDADEWEDEEFEEESWEDDPNEWVVGKKLQFSMADLDLKRWLDDLRNDREALIELYGSAAEVTPERDAKLGELKRIIAKKIRSPLNEGNKKVLIFTAFADTAEYLYRNLRQWILDDLKLHCALVCGNRTETTFGGNKYDTILTNFSPRSKRRAEMTNVNGISEAGEISILIATDCISEGQNLQDCDFLVNYDIHWNPVRIIQRFGRIDRLGTVNKHVQLVNFWPTDDLEKYIKLKGRVEARMALSDVTATGDENILDESNISFELSEDLKFRQRQLHKLRDEVLDLEEMDASASLTDFTLDDFRSDLLDFLGKNKKHLQNAPLGLFAVVSDRQISPGIIFCLAQKADSRGNEKLNPLNPYYLIYVDREGNIRYNYTHPKLILEIFRQLCQGRRQPFADLCRKFEEETEHGKNMEHVTGLLKAAIRSITKEYREKSYRQLTFDRSAAIGLPEQQLKSSNDFELITWLVIK